MRDLELIGAESWRWSFDVDRVLEALEILDIKRRVVLRVVSARNHRGIHRFYVKPDPRAGYHSITIDKDVSAVDAGRILWHELTHAWQTETWLEKKPTDQAGVMAYEFRYKQENIRVGYMANPFEVEARDNECMNDDIPLVATRHTFRPR